MPRTLTANESTGWDISRESVVKADVYVGSVGTRAVAVAKTIPSSVIAIRTTGYYTDGDGGGALYKRAASEPSHAGKFQSTDGAWWELSEPIWNVKMLGAKGDGVTDDTDAFSNAAKGAPANEVNTLLRPLMPTADWVVIRVPASATRYKVNSLVDTNNRNVVWECDASTVIDDPDNVNGRILRPGVRISAPLSAITDQATGFSVMNANRGADLLAEVNGFTRPANIARGSGRDTVGMYIENSGGPQLYGAASVTSYSATGAVLSTALSADQLKKIRVGMFAVTRHTPTPWAGFITAFTSTTLTVTAWYPLDGSSIGTASTPTGTDGIDIDGTRKIFGLNVNALLLSTSFSDRVNAFELGLRNDKGDPTGRGGSIEANGLYSVNLSHSTYYGDAAFLSGGKWVYGFRSQGSVDVAFAYSGNFSPTGDPLTSLIDATNAGGNKFYTVSSIGATQIGPRGGAASTPVYIDFHSSGRSTRDARIISTGGTASPDQGHLAYGAASHTFDGYIVLTNEGLRINDTNASHSLIVKAASDLSADRILSIATGDADRILDISAASVTISSFGASLVDDANASAARTTLGLGTAATVNTGTSGNTIPLLDGTNTWSGNQTITSTATGIIFTLQTTEDSATEGPTFLIRRISTTPAASDILGSVAFQGRDSANNNTTYSQVMTEILDPTDGSEDGRISFRARINNVSTTILALGPGAAFGDASDPGENNVAATGTMAILSGTAIPAGGTAGSGYKMSSTANFGIFFGSGAPTLSAAQGSIYLRSDGSSTTTRLYVNTNGSTTWTNVATAA